MNDREFEAWWKSDAVKSWGGPYDLAARVWQAAVKQEREAILAAIDDIEEPAWYGYENPNTWSDGKNGAMAVIHARSGASRVEGAKP